ncbi:uncharacterized protein LOC143288556 [Babylonia areolata]|uniref:uncharacterized protein LOC143288556 n=1 Tax=Babylonia areolata TaxID=304850 RepID=UPI003FD38361
MEQQEKTLLRRIAKNIAKDEPSISDKEIKTYFHQVVEDLPLGDLRNALHQRSKKCVQFLVRSVRKALSKKELEPASQNGVIDADHTDKEEDVSQGDANTPRNPGQVPPPSFSVGHLSAGVTGGHIVQLLQRGDYSKETGNQINQLWSQIPDTAVPPEVAGLDQHCLLLMMTDGCPDIRVFRNVLHHCFTFLTSDLESIKSLGPTERAREKLESLAKFLKMCLLRRSRFAEDTTVCPSTTDFLIALASIYLDLFIIVYREAELSVGEQKQMTRLVKQLTSGTGERALDVCLQMSVEEQETAYFCPLIRHLMREQPDQRSVSHYLRYVLTARRWKHLWSMLEDVVKEVRSLRAPRGFMDWMNRWSPEACHHLPADRKFKGRAVTAFLLDDADESMISSLINAVAVQTEGTMEGDADSNKDLTEDSSQLQPAKVADISKKSKKKKKKTTVTINENEELGLDSDDQAVDSIVSGNRGAAKIVSENAVNGQELEDNVEVFDWTSFGLEETGDTADMMNSGDLFMIDRGGKRSSTRETGPPVKKKRKAEVPPPPPAEQELGSAVFFIDRGQGKKAKKPAAEMFEESGSAPRKVKKLKDKDGDDGDESGEEGGEGETGVVAEPSTAQSASLVAELRTTKKKKKKKEGKTVEESSAPAAVEGRTREETDLTGGPGEENSACRTPREETKKKKAGGSGSAGETPAAQGDKFLQQVDQNSSSAPGEEPKKKKKRASDVAGHSPSGKKFPENLRFSADQGETSDRASGGEVLAEGREVDGVEGHNKRRGSKGEGRVRETDEEGRGGEKTAEEEAKTHNRSVGSASETPSVSPGRGEKRKAKRKSDAMAPAENTSSDQTSHTQRADHKGKAPNDSLPSQDTSSEKAAPEQDASAKKKRKGFESVAQFVSPTTRSVCEIAQAVSAQLEVWSESSASPQPEVGATSHTGGLPAPLTASQMVARRRASMWTAGQEVGSDPHDRHSHHNTNNDSFVPDSVSNSEGEGVMAPDLRVHLKTQSPDAGQKGSSSAEFTLSPVFVDRAKSAGGADTVRVSPGGVSSTEGQGSGRSERQRTLSPATAGAVEEQSAGEHRPEQASGKSSSRGRQDTKKRKSSSEERTKGDVEEARGSATGAEKSSARRKSITMEMADEAETKSGVDADDKNQSPLEKTRKRKSSAKEARTETEDVNGRQSATSGTPQEGAKPKAKTPKSTTPVSRRTRSHRQSVAPTVSATLKAKDTDPEPPQENTPAVKPVGAREVDRDSVRPSSKASRDAPSVPKAGPDPSTVRPARRKMAVPSEGKASTAVPSATRRKASQPAKSTGAGSKTVSRKSLGPQVTSPPSEPGERRTVKQPAEKRGSFTKLKPVAERSVSAGAKSPKAAVKTGARETKEADVQKSPRKSSAGKTSPVKSPSSSSLASVSPERQTRSLSRKKGYNLRRSIKMDH